MWFEERLLMAYVKLRAWAKEFSGFNSSFLRQEISHHELQHGTREAHFSCL
jgi:hypothetical protein